MVDEPANNRRFLFVKNKEKDMGSRVGNEVANNGNGTSTEVKKNEGQGSQPAAPAQLQMTATTKANVLKSLATAEAIILAQKARVAGAVETGTTDEVPTDVADQIAKATTELAAIAPTAVEKVGFKQLTPERLTQLQAARDGIDSLLAAVKPPPAPAATAASAASAAPVDTAEVAKVAKAAAKEVAQVVEDSVATSLEAISKGIEAITTAMNAQSTRVDKLEKARGGTNTGGEPSTPVTPLRTSTKKSGDAWSGGDLSAQRATARKSKAGGNETSAES